MSKFIERIKIGILGESRVGKTHFLYNFLYGHRGKQAIAPTIAVQFYEQIMNIKEQQVALRIWDSSGLQKYKNIIGYHLKECQVLILMYDLTNRETFFDLQTRLKQLKSEGAVLTDKKIIIIGNKADLVTQNDTKREIQEYQVKILLKKYKLSVRYIYEICSKLGEEEKTKVIRQIMNSILGEVLQQRNEDQITSMRVKLGQEGILATEHEYYQEKEGYCGQCSIY